MKIILFTFLFVLLGYSSFSQANKAIDELTLQLNNNTKQDTTRVLLLLKLATACYGVNPKNMESIAEEAIQLSEKLNFKKGTAEAYKLLGLKFFSTGDFIKAEQNLSIALQKYQEINHPNGIILCYSNLGSVALIQNKYPEALQNYQNSIRVAQKAKLPQKAGMAYGNMGIIYSEQKKYDLALKHFNEALLLHTEAKYLDGISSSYGNIGNVYFNTKNYEKAIEYFTKDLNIKIELNQKLGMSLEYGNLATVFSEQNQFQKSFEYYTKAVKINEEIDNKKGIANNNKGIGAYYLKQDKLDEALFYFNKAKILAIQLGIKDVQQEVYKSLSEVYEKQTKVDSAYHYFKKYFDIKESIDNENNRKQISRLEVQYEFDTKEEKYKTQQLLDAENLKQQQLNLALNNAKLTVSNKERDLVKLNFLKTQSDLKTEQLESFSRKKLLLVAEKEVKLKKNEIEIANLNLEANKKQRWYYIAGLFLMGIIGSLLFYQSYHRQKTNQKLQTLNNELDEANQAKVRFLGILNHDLRSPVANLIHFLHLQQDSPELLDEESIKRLQNKTTTGVENLLTSMEDILLWSKGQMQNFNPQLKTLKISSLFDDLNKHFESQDKVLITFEDMDNLSIITDEDYLKTILRNLIGNALKALAKTNNPAISCKAWTENKQNFLSISDNGPGASQEQFKALYDDHEVIGIKTGLGLHLIRDLAKAINCKISVESKADVGTVFKLKI